MKTDNELIAEFMGYPSFEKDGKRYWRIIDVKWDHLATESKELRYDKKWDDLMPVVEKIAQIGIDDGTLKGVPGMALKVCGQPIAQRIETHYAHIVAFIKWYNTQKEKGI